jgi:hypothetical protein
VKQYVDEVSVHYTIKNTKLKEKKNTKSLRFEVLTAVTMKI